MRKISSTLHTKSCIATRNRKSQNAVGMGVSYSNGGPFTCSWRTGLLPCKGSQSSYPFPWAGK